LLRWEIPDGVIGAMVGDPKAASMMVLIIEFLRNARRSRGGSVAIQLGLSLIAIIGMVALGTEISLLLWKQRQMQMFADAAAFSAATAVSKGYPAAATEAKAVGGQLALQNINNYKSDVTVTVNIPPLSGNYTNASYKAVEVIVSEPQTLSLVTLITQSSSGLYSVGARAVATPGGGTYCVLQLNSSSNPGLSMNNGAVANLTQCGLAVDSTGTSALSLSGGAALNASSVSVVGTASITNGAAVNPSSALKTSQANVADPYAGVAMPSHSGCSLGTGKSYGHGTWNLSPGVWCNGVSFTNDAVVNLAPGIYFVDRGNFDVGGAVQLTGTGVTIVLTSSTGSNYADVTIGNGATVTLSGPTSGATEGIVFFGDRNAPASNTSSITGGAAVNISGAFYFPTQTVIFQNGASNPAGCTQLIAGTIQLTGGSSFQNNCSTGVASIGSGSSTLVE
jgi:Flp pilus assembly protein TadG